MAEVTDKTPVWRNVKVLGWLFQLGILGFVLLVGAYLVSNLVTQSSNQGINLGFGFVDQPASFTIPANDFNSTQSVSAAIYQGILNTLRVVIAGLILSTILGIGLGFGRLSGNMLLRAVCTTYIEVIRNIPLLGLLVLAYLGFVLEVFPTVEESLDLAGIFILNNRGFTVPWVTGPLLGLLGSFLGAGAVAYGVHRWRRKTAEDQGEPAHLGLWVGLSFAVVFFWLAFFSGMGFSGPAIEGRSVAGGMTMQPEYFALLLALTLYTASHIGEIIRGSILAVDRGQVEASQAMALNGWQRMRHIVFPQALRVAIPPLGNQYLNLMKNSSLGFVVSYFELTKVVSTTVGTRSPAVPAYVVLLVIYLVMSLIISVFVNMANRKLEVADR